MKSDLIERYIYAVTRRLPRKQREDVSRELGGLIDDMLAERCGGMTPAEKDIRVVLTELGSPQELYEKYSGDDGKCLIGQPYYSTYLFVLKIVLACVAFGMTVSSLLLQLMEPQAWYAAAGQWLAMLWQGLLGAFAFVTILFAVFYHKGIQISKPFDFDDLPPVPKKREEISHWEPIVGIAFSVVFLTLFLAVPQVFSIYYEGREWIPVFHVDALRGSWYILVAFAAVGIIREAVKLLERRYSRKVLAVTAGANAVSALLAVWWLTGYDLFNPVFQQKMADLFTGGAGFIAGIMTHFQYLFLGILLFALVLDTADTLVKTLRK